MKRLAYLAGLYVDRSRKVNALDQMCHGHLAPELREAFDMAIEILSDDMQHLEKELIEEARNEKQNQEGSPRLPEGPTE